MSADRILVVKDEHVVRHVPSTYLKPLGWDVSAAGPAKKPSWCFKGRPLMSPSWNLVLPGMHGLKVLEAIKAASPDTEARPR